MKGLRIYEINARAHCQNFDQITEAELARYRRLGFDVIWLMGVWQISEGARKISKILSADFEGSPYAVPQYRFNPGLGGKRAFVDLVRRAHDAGLRVIVDFVSNHTALDSPWIDENPEFFIRSDVRMRKQATGEFFLHPSGEVIAFGRDPYFPPWHDTAQLDFTAASLRRHMTDTLRRIAQAADGVRCDMAMLVMRDYIREQWYPFAPDNWFNARMPGEFWDAAIAEVKGKRPDFTFIAEAYWDKEPDLLRMGFDLAYEKNLYDGLVARNPQLVAERLQAALANGGALYFIENHDEPRAAAVWPPHTNLMAAALILSLPGAVLIHEGQMEGRRERLPVQRIRPLVNEEPIGWLRGAYEQLLTLTAAPVFRRGRTLLFETGVHGAVAFLRQDESRTVAYIGQISEAWHRLNAVPVDVTALARAVGAARWLRLTNLLNGQSLLLESRSGAFSVTLSMLGVSEHAEFALLEAGVG